MRYFMQLWRLSSEADQRIQSPKFSMPRTGRMPPILFPTPTSTLKRCMRDGFRHATSIPCGEDKRDSFAITITTAAWPLRVAVLRVSSTQQRSCPNRHNVMRGCKCSSICCREAPECDGIKELRHRGFLPLAVLSLGCNRNQSHARVWMDPLISSSCGSLVPLICSWLLNEERFTTPSSLVRVQVADGLRKS